MLVTIESAAERPGALSFSRTQMAATVTLCAALLTLVFAASGNAQGQLGVAPGSAWTCPASHPIKGNFTTYNGESCIHHMPGGRFYDKTKPERCYATENAARKDGCRRSKR
jgi:hypothetical protein